MLGCCQMTWGCQAGVETANLTTVIKYNKIRNTESYESIKLGICLLREAP